MVNVGKKEMEGIVAHFYTAGFMAPIGEHALEIGPEFPNPRLPRVFFAKFSVIINVPPVTLACPET